MEKILRIYKIPNHDSIVNVIADSTTPPVTFSEGDYYMDHTSGELYEADGDSTDSGEWNAVSDISSVGSVFRVKSDTDLVLWEWDGTAFTNYGTAFPSSGPQAEMYDFTYTAQRMGNAPTITGTLMYERCLDEEWTDRVCTLFNGMLFFIDKTPTSSKANTDARYKHEISFTSERILLEHVYFLNVADPDNPDDHMMNDMTEYNFFGGISTFVRRLNLSMQYSRLGSNGVGFNVMLDSDQYTSDFISGIEEEERLIDVNKLYLKGALDLINSTWNVPYYFDGYDIHIGFSNSPLAANSGVSIPDFEYGSDKNLLTITKSIGSDSIVNRMTGKGGSENIPYYYPNENPNALIVHYEREDSEIQDGASIINPYKTYMLSARSGNSAESRGNFFIYGTHLGTYNYKQSETLNPIYENDPITGIPTAVVNPNIAVCFNGGYWGNIMNASGVAPESGNSGRILKKKILFKVPEYYTGSGFSASITDVLGSKDPFMSNPRTGELVDSLTPVSNRLKRIQLGIYLLPVDFSFDDYCSYARDLEKESWYMEAWDAPSPRNLYPGSSNTYLIDWHSGYGSTQKYAIIQGWNNGQHYQTQTINDIDYEELFPITQQENVFPSERYIYIETTYYYPTLGSTFASPMDSYMKSMTDFIFSLQIPIECWLKDGSQRTALYNYGIKVNTGVSPQLGDIIYFTKTEKQPYQSSLMPYVFRQTGDIWYNAENNTYPKGNGYYQFENEYVFTHAKELVEDFDVKPSITGIYNDQTPHKRIDKFLDITFDQNDNNEKTQDGQYMHPFFYVKLPRTSVSGGYGFNLFDCAIDGGNMTISMTSGKCGGCEFEIAVKVGTDGYISNPIGLYDTQTTVNGITYAAGTPKRDGAGNVLTDQLDQTQQDTSKNDVWIALRKDDKTFKDSTFPISGTIQPSVNDTFVILNILLPQAYIIAAEQRLEKSILDRMEELNPEKFSFTIVFSRAYYSRHVEMLDRWINESSRLNILYDGNTYDYFASSYSVKQDSSSPYPAITITLNSKALVLRSRFVTMDQIETVRDYAYKTSQEDDSSRVSRSADYLSKHAKEFDGTIKVEDIVFGDGSELSKKLEELKKNISINSNANSIESTWGRIGGRTEIRNLFPDGNLKYKHTYERIELVDDDSTLSLSEEKGITGLVATISKNGSDAGGVHFGNKIYADENKYYTVTFKFSSETTDPDYSLFVTYYGNKTKISEETIPLEDTGGEFSIKAVNLLTPDNTDYFEISVLDDSGAASEFSVAEIMVVENAYAIPDDNGYYIPSLMCPTSFIPGDKDMDLALSFVSSASRMVRIPLSGTQNGSNAIFTANAPFITGQTKLYLNGQLLTLNEDYTENSSTVIEITTFSIEQSDVLTLFGYLLN